MSPIPQRTSLSAQTCRLLRERLAAGEWQETLPGEKELCRRLHVSRITLRTALAQLEDEGLLRVSKGRRREITADSSKPAALPFAPARVTLLSPVAHAQLTSVKLLWIDELREQLAASSLPLDFVVSAAVGGARPGRILRELAARHADTVWVLLRSSAQVQRWFAAQRLPVVVAGSLHPGADLPSVDIDYFATCRHAAGRLTARGCQRLGLVLPHDMLAGDRESEAGFRDGAGGCPVTLIQHDGTPDGLCRTLDAAMRAPQAPGGLLVCHSTHAITTLSHLLHHGWQVPRQVRLISRDDDPFLAHVTPALTRYTFSPAAYASHVARAVRRFLDGSTAPLPPDLLLPEFCDGATL